MKNFMLVILALVLVSSMALAQSSAVTLITIEAASTVLTVANIDGGATGVIRGVTYQCVYDAYGDVNQIYPNNNSEASDPVGVDINGDPSSSIVVEMDLPDHLLGIGGTSMAITFPSSGPGGGVRQETAGFFNPNVSNTFSLGTGGICNLRVGFVFTVPANTAISSDIYTGQIFTNAYYTGL